MKTSSTTTPGAGDHGDDLPRMSRAQFWSVLGLGLTLFLFQAGPIWRHPWDMGLVNGAILWSYVLLLPLVIGCLAWSKHLSLRAVFLDTLTLALIKYTCTFAFALVLWEVTPAPRDVHAAPLPRRATTAEVEPAPTPLDPASTGSVEGVVADAAGHPIEGALVWIAGGLEDHVFAPPSAPLSVANAGAGMTPPLVVVQAGQPILARSADGQLHTMVAVKDGRTLFHAPLLASGDPSRVGFREAEGLVTVHCNAHQGSGEAEGQVLVVGHPFFTWTTGGGRFALHGVPAGRVRLAAYADGRRWSEKTIDVAPGGAMRTTLVASPAHLAADDEVLDLFWPRSAAPGMLTPP